MADVPGKFFSATKVRTGVAPSSSGSLVGEPLPPVNPPGSSLNSVGLTMPSAFTVSNSPLTANGTIGVAGAGTVGQYIRGDGSLADFPESSGGGSSVSYYLNGSISQGTIGGVAYKELNKVPILGAGTDFTINADGYIASFITDAGDPNLLEIPGGNWNFETYFSASSSGGTPTFYVELYKYDGTTFTLIASSSSSPELIAFGTNLNPYFSTLAVPTTTLALTDRLAIRYYVTHSGRTITLHTENNHLCQVVTTFTTGLTSLNGLTAQVQNLAVGTSGTDFNIASATATHTFNLPTASATNRGALSSADWSLFTQAYNDKINSAAVTGTTTKTLTLTQQDGGTITASWSDLNTDAVTSVFGRTGAIVAANGDYTTAQVTESGNLYYTEARVSANTDVSANTAARHNAVTIGTANGLSLSTQQLSLALASGSTTGALSSTDWNTFNSKQPAGNYVTTNTAQTISGEKTFTNSIILKNSSTGLVLSSFYADRLQIGGLTYSSEFIFPATSRFWNLPDATGTIALVGGAGVGTVTSVAALTLGTSGTDLSSTVANSTTTPVITLNVPTASATNRGALSAADWTTFNNKQNALTNPVTGTGASGQVAYFNGTTSITSESNLFWDATNDRLGIGTATPNQLLHLYKASSDVLLALQKGSNYGYVVNDGTNIGLASDQGSTGYKFLVNRNAPDNAMIINSSGNLGLGVTPSAWSLGTALDVANGPAILGFVNETYLINNAYFNSGFKYKQTSFASMYVQNSTGEHRFFTAPSGTAAGNPITFTQAMTLFATGNLLVGTPSPISDNGARLQVSGAGGVNIKSGNGDQLLLNNAGERFTQINFSNNSSSKANIWWDNTNTELVLLANSVGTGHLRIASTGAATFSSSVRAGTHFSLSGRTTSFGYQFPDWQIYNTTGGGLAFNNYSTDAMTITSGGNVLIGTTTDSGGKLRVDGDVFINNSSNAQIGFNTTGALNTVGAYQYFNRSGSNKWTAGMGPLDGSDNYQIVTGGVKALQLTVSTGAATFSSSVETGDVLRVGAGGGGGGVWTWGGSDAYIYSPTGKSLWLSSGSSGTNGIKITTGGNVLIGTTDDNSNKLRVNGNVWLDAPTSGKVSIVNSSGVSTTIGVGATTGYVGTNSDHQLDFFTNNNVLATLKTDGQFEVQKIKTAGPTGGTAQPWRLGSAATVSPTSPNRTIEVEVNGTTYYLHAKTTNN